MCNLHIGHCTGTASGTVRALYGHCTGTVRQIMSEMQSLIPPLYCKYLRRSLQAMEDDEKKRAAVKAFIFPWVVTKSEDQCRKVCEAISAIPFLVNYLCAAYCAQTEYCNTRHKCHLARNSPALGVQYCCAPLYPPRFNVDRSA